MVFGKKLMGFLVLVSYLFQLLPASRGYAGTSSSLDWQRGQSQAVATVISGVKNVKGLLYLLSISDPKFDSVKVERLLSSNGVSLETPLPRIDIAENEMIADSNYRASIVSPDRLVLSYQGVHWRFDPKKSFDLNLKSALETWATPLSKGKKQSSLWRNGFIPQAMAGSDDSPDASALIMRGLGAIMIGSIFAWLGLTALQSLLNLAAAIAACPLCLPILAAIVLGAYLIGKSTEAASLPMPSQICCPARCGGKMMLDYKFNDGKMGRIEFESPRSLSTKVVISENAQVKRDLFLKKETQGKTWEIVAIQEAGKNYQEISPKNKASNEDAALIQMLTSIEKSACSSESAQPQVAQKIAEMNQAVVSGEFPLKGYSPSASQGGSVEKAPETGGMAR